MDLQMDSPLVACAGCGVRPDAQPDVTLRRCAGCRSIGYCGEHCQKKHWPTHKKDCKRLQAEAASKSAADSASAASIASDTSDNNYDPPVLEVIEPGVENSVRRFGNAFHKKHRFPLRIGPSDVSMPMFTSTYTATGGRFPRATTVFMGLNPAMSEDQLPRQEACAQCDRATEGGDAHRQARERDQDMYRFRINEHVHQPSPNHALLEVNTRTLDFPCIIDPQSGQQGEKKGRMINLTFLLGDTTNKMYSFYSFDRAHVDSFEMMYQVVLDMALVHLRQEPGSLKMLEVWITGATVSDTMNDEIKRAWRIDLMRHVPLKCREITTTLNALRSRVSQGSWLIVTDR